MSIFANPLSDGIFKGTLNTTLIQIAPNIAKELTLFGVEKLASKLGLDPRISLVLNTTLSSTLGTFFGNAKTTGQNIITVINDGFKKGIVNAALNFAGEKSGLSPLMSALTSRSILLGFESGLSGTQNNILGNIFSGLKASVFSALSFDAPTNDASALENAKYLSKISNFTDTIKNQGLAKALENHIGSILQRDAVEDVFKQGGIAQIISGKATVVKDSSGNAIAVKLNVNDKSKVYLDPTKTKMIGRDFYNVQERGEYYTDPATGEVRLLNGRAYQDHDWGFAVGYIEKGILVKTSVIKNDASFGFSMSSNDPGVQLVFDGYKFGGTLIDESTSQKITFSTPTAQSNTTSVTVQIPTLPTTKPQITNVNMDQVKYDEKVREYENRVQAMPNGNNRTILLSSADKAATATHGITFGHDIVTFKQIEPIVIKTEFGSIKTTYSKADIINSSGTRTLTTVAGDYEEVLSGGFSSDVVEDEMSLTIKRTGLKGVNPTSNVKVSAFTNISMDNDDLDIISAFSSKDLLGKYPDAVTLGSQLEYALDTQNKITTSAYAQGDSLFVKTVYTDTLHNKKETIISEFEMGQNEKDEFKKQFETKGTYEGLSDSKKTALAIYESLSLGNQSVSIEAVQALELLYKTQLQNMGSLTTQNINTISNEFSKATDDAQRNFQKQIPSLIMDAFSLSGANPITTNIIGNISVSVFNELFKKDFVTGLNS